MMMMIIIIINRFNTETNDISTMNRNKQNSCNTVFPRDIVCLRNMSINTLHKGDDDDDDDDNNNNNVTAERLALLTSHPKKFLLPQL